MFLDHLLFTEPQEDARLDAPVHSWIYLLEILEGISMSIIPRITSRTKKRTLGTAQTKPYFYYHAVQSHGFCMSNENAFLSQPTARDFSV